MVPEQTAGLYVVVKLKPPVEVFDLESGMVLVVLFAV